MSKESYSKWWIKSKRELKELQELDVLVRKTTAKTKDRNIANNTLGNLYGRYCITVQNLDACVDQSCQAQKLMTMRKLIGVAVYRLNELRNEFLKIDYSEYHYIDGNLVELKVIPHDVQILYPTLNYPRPYEIMEMWEKLKKGDTIYVPSGSQVELLEKKKKKQKKAAIDPLAAILEAKQKSQLIVKERSTVLDQDPSVIAVEDVDDVEKKEDKDKPAEKEEKTKPKRQRQLKPPTTKELTPEEIEILSKKLIITNAVNLIQTHERARQARLYYGDLDNLRRLRAFANKKAEGQEKNIDDESALKIQTVWRGYTARQDYKRREKERRLLIGMTEPSQISKEEQEKFRRNIEKRRELREQRYKEYIKANLNEKERVLKVIGPGLMEDIGDEIKEWFKQWYLIAKAFDKYPDEEIGGTVLVIRGETLTPEEYLIELMKRKKEKKKSPADKKKEKEAKLKAKKDAKEKAMKEKLKAKKEAAAAKKREMKGDFEFGLGDTEADKMCDIGFKEYNDLWQFRPDDENPNDAPYMEMITDEKCYEMQLELRKQVDELMRLELDLLNIALAKDKRKKPPKRKRKKKAKKKKGKKDPTGKRKIQDLFQELYNNGIIREYPKMFLDEFKGDFSYKNWDLRMQHFDPLQNVGDIRHAVVMNCILPLGVEEMKKPKSVLIAGPRQSGKHILANAIFTATNCVLFDLSMRNMVGKYPGKKELNLLIHKVDKMSKILQPSIIFFDGAEKPFYKKVPKQEKDLEPKRLGKHILKKLVKPIKPEHRVLVLGITDAPYAAKGKSLNKAYEKIILIPPTDYGSVYLYWRELLMPYHGIDRDINLSALAKLTVGYPYTDIKNAIDTLMTAERIISLKAKPLKLVELYDILMVNEPVGVKEFNKFFKWYMKTPLGKKRNVINKLAEKTREQAAKVAEKDKQKKIPK